MSFFSSLTRFISSMFGLAEGATERATDKILSGSADNIRSQFRKTKEDWTKDYHNMREAVAELMRLREDRASELKNLEQESSSIEQKMAGAVELYKKNNDERYREAYAKLAARNEEIEVRMKELAESIQTQNQQIEKYKVGLTDMQKQIAELSREEAETVADIVSGQKIKELNDRLSGMSLDSQSKNLQAIREARSKSKAMAKLSNEMAGTDSKMFEKELEKAGSASKHLNDFDALITGKKAGTEKVTASDAQPSSLEYSKKQDAIDVEIQNLLEGVNVKK